MNSQSATFILRTCDLPTNASGENSSGATNNSSGSSYTWRNIDMRTILGDMYDKYDSFNIGLVNCVSTVQPTGMTYPSNNDKIGILYMSGLRWLNSNYDCGSKTRTNNACIGYVNFAPLTTSVGTAIQYNNLSLNSISRPHANVNLTIFFNNVSANVSNSTSAQTFPQMAFQFVIYPIINKDTDTKEGSVNHRMIL